MNGRYNTHPVIQQPVFVKTFYVKKKFSHKKFSHFRYKAWVTHKKTPEEPGLLKLPCFVTQGDISF